MVSCGEKSSEKAVKEGIIEYEAKVVDFNHPLAGTDLKFEGEILAVRAATQDEIDHGHAHGPGGHHH